MSDSHYNKKQPEWNWLELFLEQMFGLLFGIVKLLVGLLTWPFRRPPPDAKM